METITGQSAGCSWHGCGHFKLGRTDGHKVRSALTSRSCHSKFHFHFFPEERGFQFLTIGEDEQGPYAWWKGQPGCTQDRSVDSHSKFPWLLVLENQEGSNFPYHPNLAL